jgi:hypothetical protein
MARKGTPKFEVVTTDTRVVIETGVSKTFAKRLAAHLNVGGRKSVEVRPVRKLAA